MAKTYDLVVIGTETAASVAAFRCCAAGLRVAMIDHLPFGGTCALRGCDPKKVLVGMAESVDQVRRLRGKGISGGEPTIDWPQLIAFKRSFTDSLPPARAESFAKNGIDALSGRARFRGARTLVVGEEVLEASFILIATGAVPMKLGIPGEEHVATSDQFLELERLPERLVLLGGGYIAAEFSHIAARAGARVTVVEQKERMLTRFDGDLVSLLQEKSTALGIDLRLNTKVEAIEKVPDGLRVTVSSEGARSTLRGDLVVHAAGRVPDLESLDLAAGHVEQRNGRLTLNDFLQSTSNPAVYAAGDVASQGPPLTPVASHDGKIVAANILGDNQERYERPDYTGVPSVVFTIPPLARVGLLEEEARQQGLRFRVQHKKTSSWYTARRVGEDCAGFKVLIEEGTERILGAHLIGPDAEEVINLFAFAIRNGLGARHLKSTLFAYPTAASDIGYVL